MSKCYLCGQELNNKNKTIEHIIPNALGGKLKTKEILCKACNNSMGETIDNNLVKFFEFANVLTNPKRDRKGTQQFQAKIDGQDVFVKSGGEITTQFKPKITKMENGANIEFTGSFTSKKDEEKCYKQILECVNGLSKNKQYTLDEIKTQAKVEIKQPIIHCQMRLLFNDLFLGYLKILLGFCAFKEKIQHIDPNIFVFFKDKNLQEIHKIASLCKSELLKNNGSKHRIYLIGKKSEKWFLGLVSIYSFCVLFKLNSNYEGEDFVKGYYYDIHLNKEINENLKALEVLSADIEQYYRGELMESAKKITEMFCGFVADIAKNQCKLSQNEFRNELYKIILQAIKQNQNLQILLQDENGLREFIMNDVGFYYLYRLMCNLKQPFTI